MMVCLAMLAVLASTGVTAPGFLRVTGSPAMDRGVFVSPTSDGGFIVTGVTKNTGGGDEDILLVKFDGTGEPVWTRNYGGADTDNGWSVHELDGGYAVAGYTKSTGAGGFDCYLMVTDREGEMQWSKTYGGEADDRCWSMLPLADGGFVLAGETFSEGAGEEDFLLVKTDPHGEEEWRRTYGGQQGDRCFSIAERDGGGFVLAGQTYSEGAGERDAHIIATNGAGEEIWSRTLGGPARDLAHSIVRTDDGHYVTTGYTASFASSKYDPWLIKIDAKGDTLWTQAVPVAAVGRGITGAQAADGGFFITGLAHNPATRSSAALLLKTDPEGMLEWSREFLGTTSGQSFGYTVRATADGGCVFTGHTTVGSAGDLDLFIIKVDAEGE